jgi:hypothetical protein
MGMDRNVKPNAGNGQGDPHEPTLHWIMTRIRNIAVAIFIVGSVASPLQADDGFLVVQQTTAGSTIRTAEVQIERDRMRAEMTGAPGGTRIVTFDGPQQILRIINVDSKSYTEMTKADADRIGALVNAMMAKVKEEVAKKLPRDERAKPNASTGPAGRVAGTVRPEYRRAGTDVVGKWTCDKYDVFRNEQKVMEVCTVDPKALGLTAADFEISNAFATFFANVVPEASDQIVGVGTVEKHGYNGVIVRRVVYRNGKVLSTSDVIEVRRQAFDASSYDPPAGFRKQDWGAPKIQ